jgi:hypothetical protein
MENEKAKVKTDKSNFAFAFCFLPFVFLRRQALPSSKVSKEERALPTSQKPCRQV